VSRLVLLLLAAVAIWWLLRRAQSGVGRGHPGRAQSADRAPAGFDPYRVLGIERGASPGEIRRAYRQQLLHYHPDRVAELGEELRQVAHRRTLEIQRAYDLLKAS